MYKVNSHKSEIPENRVKEALHSPAPEGEEGAADEDGAPQVEHPVHAVGREVREEEEGVRQLEVDMVRLFPFRAVHRRGVAERAVLVQPRLVRPRAVSTVLDRLY